MIADIASSGFYWCVFFFVFLSCYRILGVKPLDFKFFAILFISQYTAHASYAFLDKRPSIAIFCALFAIIFATAYRINIRTVTLGDFSFYKANSDSIDKSWILFCKLYIFIYFGIKLATSPFSTGELLLDDRLAAQQENRIVFMMGIATFPTMVACMYDWIARRFKLKIFDVLLICMIILGLIGSSSKGALLPIVLAYFGVASYMNTRLIPKKYLISLLALLMLGSFVLLKSFFPLLDGAAILELIAFRIVANTDSLEYLYVLNADPDSYPFAGIGALIPVLTKQLGYVYSYPPGVWLHGLRYDVWDGFGPNSGIVMDYFANLSWFGLSFAAVIAFYLRFHNRLCSVIGCSFASLTYLAFVDIGLFDVSFLFCLAVFFAIVFCHFLLDRVRSAHAHYSAM